MVIRGCRSVRCHRPGGNVIQFREMGRALSEERDNRGGAVITAVDSAIHAERRRLSYAATPKRPATWANRRSWLQKRSPASVADASRWTSIHPSPLPASRCASTNASTSSCSTTGACGRLREQPQDLAPASQRAAGEFADDERMAEHGVFQKQPGELSVGEAQDGRPKRTCRRGSRRLPPDRRATPGNGSKCPFGAAESRQAPGAFSGDQRFKAGPDHRCFLAQAAQLRRPVQQGVVNVQGGPHMHQYARLIHMRQRTVRHPRARTRDAALT